MPTLHWIGKEKIVNHHQKVPFRILNKKYSFKDGETTEEDSKNKIIHGDNLEALKSLLPEYEGKIDCIYIDPPYNTGNEGWAYNDNVSHPKLKKWFGEVVGKQSEDLTRHDKWLCMIYPRLKLLHKLLTPNGNICISIDDNEFAHLELILNEIFGERNKLGVFVWRRRVGSSMKSSWVSSDHEYVLVYSKNSDNAYVLGDARDMDKYNIPNGDGRKYASMPLTVGMTKEMRPNQWYALKHPESGNEYWPTEGRVWCYYPPTMEEKIRDKKIIWPEDDPNGRRTTPRLKSFPEDAKRDRKPFSTWINEKKKNTKSENSFIGSVGKNQEGTKVLKSIFGETVFNYSKPISLVELIVEQFCNPTGIVLDSFAGSGTTGQAVLSLNQNEENNRNFILIELEEYAEKITAQRIKKVISGYGNNSKKNKGIGGDFNFYELGNPLFNDNGILNENIDLAKIKRYVWFSETKTSYSEPEEQFLLGSYEGTAYYFFYNKNSRTTLNESFLRKINTKASQYIIYADSCILEKEIMDKYHIVFKKIPRDITRF